MPRAYMPKAQSHEWETPRPLFDTLWRQHYGFDLDPCCRLAHYTAQRILASGGQIYVPSLSRIAASEPGYDEFAAAFYAGRADVDGLRHPWHGKVYMNPPYGREIGAWVEKAQHEVNRGNAQLVVALVPARTDTKWWQENVCRSINRSHAGSTSVLMSATSVNFLAGRLRFGGASNSAPFPSAIVTWSSKPKCGVPI